MDEKLTKLREVKWETLPYIGNAYKFSEDINIFLDKYIVELSKNWNLWDESMLYFYNGLYFYWFISDFKWVDYSKVFWYIFDNNLFDKLDIDLVKKFFTYIVRSDRFNEWFLEYCIEKWIVLLLLKQYKKLI